MTRRRLLCISAVALAVGLIEIPGHGQRLAPRLTDQEFWKLSAESSEAGGTFHSENLVSNEIRFQSIVPALTRAAVPGRAYIGVGSEQNFTYIAASRPAIAFVVDLRRGNLNLHLIYKVLFEVSANRVEFVSRLFSRAAPASLKATPTVNEIFEAYRRAAPSQSLYDRNLKEIKATLTTKHGFKLSNDDLESIDFIYRSWFQNGPEIRYELRGGGGGPNFPTYFQLMTTPDAAGQNRSFLATEETFRFLKDLQTRNMIVPVVGNFGGPKALRAVAAYLKQQQTPVSVFYTSNVEQYLRQDGIWGSFCASVAALPIDKSSVFLRTLRAGFSGQPAVVGANGNFNLEIAPIAQDVVACSARR
jgi:hypothetical protein